MTTLVGNDDPGYRLSASGRESAERDRLATLEQLYDPLSRERRSLVRPGWRCLEVGAGRGSVAAWLAEQVGPDGEVVATDLDTRYLEELAIPNLRVVRHNLLTDSPDQLGPGSFDLVSSRHVLFWLAGRQEQAVRRMVELLRPGGWLVAEDGDWGCPGPVDPVDAVGAAHRAVYRGGEWWVDRGFDPWFGRSLPRLFERCGLVDIRHEGRTEILRGGGTWGRWWASGLPVIASQGQGEAGGSPEEVAALCAPFEDSSTWISREILHACWGRKPD
jgi:SAM-dependent methyltransferase